MKPEFSGLPLLLLQKDDSIPDAWDIEPAEGVVILVPDANRGAIGGTPWAEFLGKRLSAYPETTNPVFLSTPDGGRAAVVFVSEHLQAFKALTLARKIIGPLLAERLEAVNVISLLGDDPSGSAIAEALVAAAHAALFELPRVTDKPPESNSLNALRFFGNFENADFEYAEATAEGNNLARWLTHLPGNYLTPGIYREFAESLAREEGWQAQFYDRDKLEELGAGAFLSVVEASPVRDAGILHLQYRPEGAEGKPLALVGKGICFDTGGSNLKVGGGMLGMHGDMQGSAVALGAFLAITRMKFDEPVDCWLALAENHIGSRAVKCNDVITALDGTTIELINTDAEGRMVLSDTLALVSRGKPRAIIDYATLTGSVVAALGQRMAGAITNRREWVEPIIQAGERCGERVWPFPYEDDYDEDLHSTVADTLQCRTAGPGDHIYAARLLGRFVDKGIGWVHVDMASSGTHKGGLAHIPTDLQGFGVRFGVEWLKKLAIE
ncbi:peptidase M17 [Marinobacter vulgaris]|uniref:Peptidase M17 n=1 Tax=Marinobacter vulgaris TaxID=1928331 RepID=A0A2V3ZP21_9GAMM|nr:leucyl aminopeptidase family protein [Marinobacter vulgaris]PXX91763.1 peptidase M17 [Marinobacter vulgaris]TSJ70729.1 leucyl aminopeptidase family protein [Marinobacter vulgaris]